MYPALGFLSIKYNSFKKTWVYDIFQNKVKLLCHYVLVCIINDLSREVFSYALNALLTSFSRTIASGFGARGNSWSWSHSYTEAVATDLVVFLTVDNDGFDGFFFSSTELSKMKISEWEKKNQTCEKKNLRIVRTNYKIQMFSLHSLFSLFINQNIYYRVHGQIWPDNIQLMLKVN